MKEASKAPDAVASTEATKAEGKMGKGCFIGILIVVFAPLGWIGSEILYRARKEIVYEDVENLRRALLAYEMTYYRHPTVSGSSGEDYQLKSDSKLMNLLTAKVESPENPQKLVFWEGREIQEASEDDDQSLTDIWGQAYHILIDGNYDGRLTGPDGREIRATVAVYSLGENGVFDGRAPHSW